MMPTAKLPLEPPSPCIRQCTLDDRDECVGCGRTIDEILVWAAAPAVRKIEISEAAALRREVRRQKRLNANSPERLDLAPDG